LYICQTMIAQLTLPRNFSALVRQHDSFVKHQLYQPIHLLQQTIMTTQQWNQSGLASMEDLVQPEPWKSPPIVLQLEDRSGATPTIIDFDLSSAIRKVPQSVAKTHPGNLLSNALFFPDAIFLNMSAKQSKKAVVTSVLQRACVKAGFKLVVAEQKKTYPSLRHFTFRCNQSRAKSKSRSKGGPNRRKRKFKLPCPITGCKCPFHFKVYEHIDTKSWFLQPEVIGINEHLGHHHLHPSHTNSKLLHASRGNMGVGLAVGRSVS
jgi:hypothetical protein